MTATIWRVTRVKLLIFACAAAWVLASVVGAQLSLTGDAPRDVMDGRTNAPDSVDAILAQHSCWTGAAPADMEGKLPGHVVVMMPDDRAVYGGPRMVAKALDQVFKGADHGFRVIGFCR